jgi:hypothetical protein
VIRALLPLGSKVVHDSFMTLFVHAVHVLPSVWLFPWVLMLGVRPYRAALGMWAAYAPRAQIKLLHAVDGDLHCISPRVPSRTDAARHADWNRAFRTPTLRRVAENWVVLDRLYRAGLGPEPLELLIAPRYRAWFSRGWTFSAGYRVANLRTYPVKDPTTEEQVRAAGVIPDRNRACLREQIRGYVSDLNALHGVMPDGGADEVAAVEGALAQALATARGQGPR